MPPNPWLAPKPKWLKPKRVIIAGTRTFDNYKLLKDKVELFTFWFEDIEVVSGAQRLRVERDGEWTYVGADFLGEQWAMRNWWTIHRFYPDWRKHGKSLIHTPASEPFYRLIDYGKTSDKSNRPSFWQIVCSKTQLRTWKSRGYMALPVRLWSQANTTVKQAESQKRGSEELWLPESEENRHVRTNSWSTDRNEEVEVPKHRQEKIGVLALRLYLRKESLGSSSKSAEDEHYLLWMQSDTTEQRGCDQKGLPSVSTGSQESGALFRAFVRRCGCVDIQPMSLLWQETKGRLSEWDRQERQWGGLQAKQRRNLLSNLQLCKGRDELCCVLEMASAGRSVLERSFQCGLGAGPIRNREMVRFATHCIAFWDGKSPGTKSLIEACELYELPHRVVRY
jgi:hypothetical protein